jgi:pyruvate dehydrogenase E2 component (dihydrolipoyllysine-residue acetyltransferase)
LSETVVRIDAERVRRRGAELLEQATREIPTFYVSKLADVAVLRALARERGETLTAVFLPLVARWLKRYSLLNAFVVDGEVRLNEQVNLGVALAYRENVLLVPALADCAGWPAERFATALTEIKTRSAADAFTRSDFHPSTFTVSNLGATGVDSFTSIITPPQSAVLSVAASESRPAVKDGEVVVRPLLPLTLGVDHRAADGHYAATALADLVSAIERPHLEAQQ